VALDFPAGGNFVLRMHEAARVSERTILVLSPAVLEAEFPAAEWAAAFVADPTGEESRLIPVRVRDCRPDGLLAAINYIDLVGLDETAAIEKLNTDIAAAITPGRVGDTQPAFPGVAVQRQARFPTALPDIWNVPFRARGFVGREDILAELRGRMDERAATATAEADAIHGLGGVGKTRLCIEFAHRNAQAFEVVWWVRATSPATLIGDLAQLAQRLSLPEAGDVDQLIAASAAQAWLQRNPGWLLIFDNAAGPDAVRDWVPVAGHGQTLITSRWGAGWGAVARSLELSVLERSASVELLCARAPGSDPGAAEELAELLGELPLALEQAGSYAQATGVSLADYAQRFRTHAAEIGAVAAPADYEATIATTWSLALEQLEHDEPARALMWTMAFMAPEQIPRALFTESNQILVEFNSEQRLLLVDAAVQALRRFSIINASGVSLEMHRLVQAVVRDRLSGAEGKRWNGAAQALLAGLLPPDLQPSAVWSLCDLLLAHTLVVSEWAGEHDNETDATVGLFYALGRYQAWRLELSTAERLLRSAMRIADRLDMGPPQLIAIRTELALVLLDVGNVAEAIALISQALSASERHLGADTLATAGVLRNRGSILRRNGDLEGARSDLRRALEIAEHDLSADDAELVGFIVNLANVESPEFALALHERAVAIVEAQAPVDPHFLAATLTNLGNTYHRLGDLSAAGEHLRRAVATYEEAYGPDFPRIAGLLASLGVTLREQNQLQESEDALRRALQIEKETFGPEDMRVVRTMTDLADLLQLNDLEQAQRVATQAVQIARASADPDANLPSPLARLGDIQRERGQASDAEPTMREALALVVGRDGERSSESVHIRVKLGAILRALNRAPEAVRQLELAAELLDESPDTFQLAATFNNLGNALDDLGRFDEAIAALKQCLSLTSELYGDQHPRVSSALVNLAIAHQNAGDDRRAVELIEQAIAIHPDCVEWQ
jgi:tetratricopeptide (TPR) repeat protein